MKRIFTQDEVERVAEIINSRAADLTTYIEWINDRPQLPERELAIANVKAERDSLKYLGYYVRTGERIENLPT